MVPRGRNSGQVSVRETVHTILVLALFSSGICFAAKSYRDSNRVMVLVSGRAITERQVWMDTYLENPKLWKLESKDRSLLSQKEQSLQRLILQAMIVEENRILRSGTISDSELQKDFVRVRAGFGKEWKDFLKAFGTSESEVQRRLGPRLLVAKAVAERIHTLSSTKTATTSKPGMKDDEIRERAALSIQEWIKQLRSRYRVQELDREADGTSTL